MSSRGSDTRVSSGIIRLCVNRERGVVCDQGWDYADASVACRQAGYSQYGMLPPHIRVYNSVELSRITSACL